VYAEVRRQDRPRPPAGSTRRLRRSPFPLQRSRLRRSKAFLERILGRSIKVCDRSLRLTSPGSRWDRLATIRAALPRGLVIALAGYAVVVVFGLAYGITRSRWPDLDQTPAVIAAVLAAAPLALALVWDRIASLKAFGFELALTSASMRTDMTDMQVVGAITERQYFSGEEALVEQITQAIVRPEQELLELNLRGGDYWWSTRLYLVAALADDYSRIQQLVFTEGGAAEAFVGMATPGDIRKALARGWPTLEISYRPSRLNRSRHRRWAHLSNHGLLNAS
jgi:hypothetical protein